MPRSIRPGLSDLKNLNNLKITALILIIIALMVLPIYSLWNLLSFPPSPDPLKNGPNNHVKIEYWGGDLDDPGHTLDKQLVEKFIQENDININIRSKPRNVTEAYENLQNMLEGKNPPDVVVLDVIWVGAFAEHLIDLKELDTRASYHHYKKLIENNTVQGKLVAMPWFVDVGLLYYRTDLLKKYGYDDPPTTWDELETMAETIQNGERDDKEESDFWGFVWQNNKDEGLTCNVLEWIASSGGGNIIENGKVTINNDNARKALERAQGWVQKISPLDYTESDVRKTFLEGNAAFMRNWPTAYSNSKPGSVAFDIASLPSEKGVNSAGTIGGAAIGVVNNTDNMDAAKEFVDFMTGPFAQEKRANEGFFIPTRPALFRDLGASQDQSSPKITSIVTLLGKINLVYRPSTITGKKYNEVSKIIYESVYRVLKEEGADIATVLADIEKNLQAALPSSTP